MKVILLQDIARVGRKLDVVDVPDGHARNHLIPRNLAKPATPQELKQVERQRQHHAAEQEAQEKAFQEMLTAFTDTQITVVMEANEKGHLFKGVHAEDISRAINERTEAKVKVQPQHVVIDAPIKDVGVHTVTLQMGEHKGTVSLSIEAKA